MRKSEPIEIMELGINELAGLEFVQDRARNDLASEVVNAIRNMLSSGQLVVKDGKVIANKNRAEGGELKNA